MAFQFVERWKRNRAVGRREQELERSLAELTSANNLLGAALLVEHPSADFANVPISLKRDENVIASFAGISLIEPRVNPRQYVSMRLPGPGKTSFRVGTQVPSSESQKVIDTAGQFIITDRRVVFVGPKRTKQWEFKNLVGYMLGPSDRAVINVTNRQRAAGIVYDRKLDDYLDTIIEAAVRRFRSEEQYTAYLQQLQSRVEQCQHRHDQLSAQSSAQPAPFAASVPTAGDGGNRWTIPFVLVAVALVLLGAAWAVSANDETNAADADNRTPAAGQEVPQ